MNAGGWIFMLASLAFVWGLAAWCFRRVLGAHRRPERDGAARRGSR